MKALGESECMPIGWSDCTYGFEKDPSGWGCREVLAETCTGATRAALGSKTCVPVGDCNAAFPPAGARLFVSTTGATDATHFRSIYSAALASRAGDIIAIDDGVYRESSQFDRAVTLVGRCAEKVIIDGTNLTTPGIISVAPTTVRGVTVRKFEVGIDVTNGLVLEDSVIEDSRGIGIYLEGAAITAKVARSVIRNTTSTATQTAFGIDIAKGTTMDIVDTEIDKSEGAGLIVTPGSKVKVSSSVVRNGSADKMGFGGYGINGQGGDATITDSAFLDNQDTGVRAYKNGTFTVERTVIRGTKAGDRGFGVGMAISTASTMTASKLTITGTHGAGIVCESSKATITDTVVRAQVPAPDGDFGDGVYAFNGSAFSLQRVAIIDNARAGADLFDAKTEVTFDHVFISGTKPLPKGDMGLGIALAFGAHAKIDSSVIANHRHTGIYVFEGGTLDLTKTAIRDTALQGMAPELGHGLLATDSKRIVVTGCEIRKSASIGVAFANSSASISQSVISDNAVGIHVQDGSTLNQVDTPSSAPANLAVDVSADTKFENNVTRIGSGTVPLPAPLPKL